MNNPKEGKKKGTWNKVDGQHVCNHLQIVCSALSSSREGTGKEAAASRPQLPPSQGEGGARVRKNATELSHDFEDVFFLIGHLLCCYKPVTVSRVLTQLVLTIQLAFFFLFFLNLILCFRWGTQAWSFLVCHYADVTSFVYYVFFF